jgi:hypothetical protein
MRIHIESGLEYRKMGDRRTEINQKPRAIVHRFDTAVETLETRIDSSQEFLEVFE